MEGYEGTIIEHLVYNTKMPYVELNGNVLEHTKKEIGLLPNDWTFPDSDVLLYKYEYLPGLLPNMTKNRVIILLRDYYMDINKENANIYNQIQSSREGIQSIHTGHTRRQSSRKDIQSSSKDRPLIKEMRGGMKNKKVKKCEEKKVVLGKERCIYKVSDSKKDYMKYKGKLVPVSDYVKSMKKKK